MSLNWKPGDTPHEWFAEAGDAYYLIDAEPGQHVELWVFWGRGHSVGDRKLGDYASFGAAAAAAEQVEREQATADAILDLELSDYDEYQAEEAFAALVAAEDAEFEAFLGIEGSL